MSLVAGVPPVSPRVAVILVGPQAAGKSTIAAALAGSMRDTGERVALGRRRRSSIGERTLADEDDEVRTDRRLDGLDVGVLAALRPWDCDGWNPRTMACVAHLSFAAQGARRAGRLPGRRVSHASGSCPPATTARRWRRVRRSRRRAGSTAP